MTELSQLVEAAITGLRQRGAEAVDAGVVLGSGLSYLADEVDDAVILPYAAIERFPRSTVEGHAGNFVVGTCDGVPVAFAQGRFHLYEGHDAAAVSLPVRVLAALGARYLLLTNAAGSLDRRSPPGSLMAIVDHVNLQFLNPLIGRSSETIDNRFPDMSTVYDEGLRRRLHQLALDQAMPLRDGVYAGVLGPSYETAAEIAMLHRVGADAVGMSTVSEVIVAAELGLPVVGVSLITNYATGLATAPLTHAEVTEVAARTQVRFGRLVRAFIAAEGKRTAR